MVVATSGEKKHPMREKWSWMMSNFLDWLKQRDVVARFSRRISPSEAPRDAAWVGVVA